MRHFGRRSQDGASPDKTEEPAVESDENPDDEDEDKAPDSPKSE
jgi:hypothetical protein